MNSLNQKTLNKSIKLCGVGLHNGIKANVTIKPADANSGINFCRVDIDSSKLIKANYQNVVEPILVLRYKQFWSNRLNSGAFNGCFFWRRNR